jgi:hypothetical protein
MNVTLIHIVAAALVVIGSGLVLRAVWLADLDAPASRPEPREAAADVTEWREAA